MVINQEMVLVELQGQDYNLQMFIMVQIVTIGQVAEAVLVMVKTKTVALEELVAVVEVEFLKPLALVQEVLEVALL